MDVDIAGAVQAGNGLFDAVGICRAVYGAQCRRIHGLDADFHLHETGPERVQKGNFLLRDQACLDLKMKVCDAVIVLCDIVPDGIRVFVAAVEGAVDELALPHLVIQEKLQFFFHGFEAAETYAAVDAREAVAAAVRTAAAGFIVEDAVVEQG